MINMEETKYMIKQLREDNEKALKIYKDSLDKVAFTTSIFINYILDDIEFIENIEPKVKNIRYIYSILRVTVEQVIIYKFLMRENVNNQSLCEDYLGVNIDIDDIEGQAGDDFELLKLLIGKRTKLYRNNFKQMAENFEDVDNDTSLYRLYSMMADHVHNSYYESILSGVSEEGFNFQFINTIILTLLTQLKGSVHI
ncbi:MAG: hypothetical protein E7A63_17765 [Clostridium butyricum]|nr:hypothetical protein [Clostridium butyricum]